MSHIDKIGATPPKTMAVKFQQKATLVARIFVGKLSATMGLSVPSVIPIKAPSSKDMVKIREENPLSKECIKGMIEIKIPTVPNRII